MGKKCQNWEWDKKNCYHDPLTHHLFPGVKKRQILFKHLFSVHFILACWDPACTIFPWRSSRICSQRYLCTAVHVRPKVYRARVFVWYKCLTEVLQTSEEVSQFCQSQHKGVGGVGALLTRHIENQIVVTHFKRDIFTLYVYAMMTHCLFNWLLTASLIDTSVEEAVRGYVHCK